DLHERHHASVTMRPNHTQPRLRARPAIPVGPQPCYSPTARIEAAPIVATRTSTSPGESGTAAVAAPASTTCPARRRTPSCLATRTKATKARIGSPRIAAVDPLSSTEPFRDSVTETSAISLTGTQRPQTNPAADALSAITSGRLN